MEEANIPSPGTIGKIFYNELIAVDHKAALTAETYYTHIGILFSWCEKNNKNYAFLTVQDLLYFLVWRKSSGIDSITTARDISALLSCLKNQRQKRPCQKFFLLKRLILFLAALIHQLLSAYGIAPYLNWFIPAGLE